MHKSDQDESTLELMDKSIRLLRLATAFVVITDVFILCLIIWSLVMK